MPITPPLNPFRLILNVTRLVRPRGADREYTRTGMQLSFNKPSAHRSVRRAAKTLADLGQNETGLVDRIDLPEDFAHRLMELGFIPGHSVLAAHSAPGGDPRVFRVDGTEIALRRETARHILLRQN